MNVMSFDLNLNRMTTFCTCHSTAIHPLGESGFIVSMAHLLRHKPHGVTDPFIGFYIPKKAIKPSLWLVASLFLNLRQIRTRVIC